MLRRLAAFLTMLAIVGLVLMLVWQVQRHRRGASAGEESVVVFVGSPCEKITLAIA